MPKVNPTMTHASQIRSLAPHLVPVRRERVLLFLLLGAALYLVGLSNDSDPAFLVSAMFLAVPMVTYVLARLNLSGLKCTVEFRHARLFEGQPSALTLKLINEGSLPKLNIIVSVSIHNTTQGTKHAYSWLVPVIGGEETLNTHITIAGLKRGENLMESVSIACESPLGMFTVQREVECAHHCLVYPMLLLPDVVGAPHSIASAVASRSFILSDPFDYRGVREYVATDDLRLIHWLSSARRGELVVRLLERQSQSPLVIVIHALNAGVSCDCWAGEPVLEIIARFAATLACMVCRAGGDVALLSGAGMSFASQTSNKSNEIPVLEHLARLTPSEARLYRPPQMIERERLGHGIWIWLTTRTDGQKTNGSEFDEDLQWGMIHRVAMLTRMTIIVEFGMSNSHEGNSGLMMNKLARGRHFMVSDATKAVEALRRVMQLLSQAPGMMWHG